MAIIDELMLDARLALRTVRHSPAFALTAVATLALGIGVNTGMFSVINGLLLRPLYQRPDEVVWIYNRSTAPDGGFRGLSYSNYLELQEGTTGLFTTLAASSPIVVGLDFGEGARRTLASAVTATYFEMFGTPLALGRAFTAEEERPTADIRVAIISHSLWRRRGDANILGRPLRINGDQFTIIGVAAERFAGASIPGPEVWLPLGAAGRPFAARDAHTLSVIGRLAAGTSVEGIAPALDTIGRRLEQSFPEINTGYTLAMSAPSRLMFFPGPGNDTIATTLGLLLMVMPAIVLLVACLNLANLLLARGLARRRELAIMSSLGGRRGRITRQLLTEGLLLALVAGAVGALLSTWAVDALLASVPSVLPIALTLPELDLDWRVFALTLGSSLAASLIFSAWPAWMLTGRAVVTDLKRQAGEEVGPPRGVRTSSLLMIGQVALSLLLLASGGLFLMGAISAATADPGYRLDGGLLVEVDPSLAGYDEARGRQSHLALADRLRTIPGVEAVTVASGLPFASMGDSRLVAPAGAADGRSQAVDAVFSAIGRDYARVLGLPMLGGRDFTDAELAPGSSEPVAIIDDALAERLWPEESALGRLIQFFGDDGPEAGPPIRVIGLVPAVKHSPGDPRPFPHVYVPLGQHYEGAMTLHVRVRDDEAERAMLATVARVVRSVDERVPIVRVETWRDHLETSVDMWLLRTGARVFSLFGGIALLLVIIGVYGVKSYVVSRRTREFGIRLAVGAQPRALLWQVLREGSRVTTIGIGIGLLLALGAGRVLQGFMYGLNDAEPVVLMIAPLILLASSLLASYIPAVRATKVDPTVALRSE